MSSTYRTKYGSGPGVLIFRFLVESLSFVLSASTYCCELIHPSSSMRLRTWFRRAIAFWGLMIGSSWTGDLMTPARTAACGSVRYFGSLPK